MAAGVLALAATLVAAQFGDLGSRNPQRVSFQAPAPVQARPGRVVSVDLVFRIAPGFHINSSVPTSDLLIPTTMRHERGNIAFRDVTFKFPEGKLVAFPFAPDEKLSVFEGDVVVKAAFKIAPRTKPGTHTYRGALRYQACTNNACFPPNEVPVEIAFVVK